MARGRGRAASLALCLGACVAHSRPTPDCPLGGERYQRTELYFGLMRSEGPIEPTSFDAFVEQHVLEQLPTGFTLLDAEGRWVDGHKDIREPSRVLIVLHRGDPADRALERIRERYKQLFHQQSVLRVDSPACARF